MNDFITSIEKFCMELISTFQERLTWKWDDRFEAVLATCETKDKDDIQLSLGRHLKTIWDNSNTENAPDVVLNAISHFGGLMPGQLFFTSEPNQHFLMCCAWWPWGDGITVSIRVAPFANNLPDEDKAALNKRVKTWFKVKQE